jgi:hypothetical protein
MIVAFTPHDTVSIGDLYRKIKRWGLAQTCSCSEEFFLPDSDGNKI